jgi:hypothetical protein
VSDKEKAGEAPKKAKGGARPGAGRKKNTAEAETADGDKNFATRVLARIGKPGWQDFIDAKKIQSDEDYALHLLAGTAGYDQFNKLLDRKFGKPVQTVNHVHDKPLEMNVNVSIAEIVRKVRQRKEEYERTRN